ncbi:hypothetical protein, partial [Anaerotignum lactatifermentans]|uniref:hypothetical protein n=1 Tax=Anaerotignum lactatifermentans TaxID=160404 RepID=UPI001A9AD686
GLATCNLQTTSPSGFLNNFNLKILSNFLGSVHHNRGFQLSYFMEILDMFSSEDSRRNSP